jgi:hypothetical protein
MPNGNGPATKSDMVREVLQIVMAAAGFFAAGWRSHRRVAHNRAKKAAPRERPQAHALAVDDSEPSNPAVTRCLHCGRNPDSLRARGCGDLTENNRCLMHFRLG